MIITRWWLRLVIVVSLILVMSVLQLDAGILAQQASLNEAIKAVVRIRGCNIAGCNVGLGSGVIIHPSGVILTANHVTLTDKNNPLSPRLDDFIIEVTENARQAPQTRYRARLLAAKPEADLALLGIYWDEVTHQPLDEPEDVKLPALASADVNTIDFGERLHILGYPLAGGSAINYVEVGLGGFDEDGALMKVQVPLSEGNSGGPALVERNGHYEIAGIVIRGRGERLEVGVIRSIDQLHTLTWEPTARRVWAENVQVTLQGTDAAAMLQIKLDIHAMDYANHNGRLLAYVFDADTHQPWSGGDSDLEHSENGQVVLRQDFSTQQMISSLRDFKLLREVSSLDVSSNQPVLRLLLWDADEARVLWRDTQWREPQPAAQVAIAPTQQPTPQPSATHTPTPTSQPTDTPTNTPTVTATATPLPTATPILRPPTVTHTPMPSLPAEGATPASQAGTFQEWRGEYYNNRELKGAPELIRNDSDVNFDWATSSPDPGFIDVDSFSVRWTRSLNLAAGKYRFRINVDDGARLWVNDQLIIDAWREQPPTTYTAMISLGGGPVSIQVEYFEKGGTANVSLSWEQID